jgi:type II secretory pathway pseudopilin PulG
MISVRKTGFTIIEVMLFLAISGFLFLGIIVGTGNSINVQRYRDSVSSLQSLLQQQFTEVNNVINDNHNVDCGIDTGLNRGQTNCIILGRYITYDGVASSNILNINTVIGSNPSGPVTDEISAFSQYDFALKASSLYDLEWNTTIKNKSNNPMKFSILMLRSPISGAVRTFIDVSDVQVNPKALLTASAIDTKAELCVDPNGLTTNKQTEVLINAGASNSSAIETIGDSTAGVIYACH